MSQKMISLVTDIQISEERLKEIFEVPKTKQLFEQFTAKEAKNVEELVQSMDDIIRFMEEKEDDDSGEEVIGTKEIVDIKIKITILAHAMDFVVNGKSLNQAIQAAIKEQIEKESIFSQIHKSIHASMIPNLMLMGMLGRLTR